MSDVSRDRAGTWRDWPVVLIALGLVLVFTDAKALGVVLFWGGIVALLLRRYAFTTRRR